VIINHLRNEKEKNLTKEEEKSILVMEDKGAYNLDVKI